MQPSIDDTAQDIMSRSLVTVTEDTPLAEARARLATGNVHHLPVVHRDQLVGIVSATDFVHSEPASMACFERGLAHARDIRTVADIMQRNPVTIAPDTKLSDVIDLLTNGGFHSLPVVQDGKLVGIVTTTDLLRRFRDALFGVAHDGEWSRRRTK
jgi:CBS domain-containing protein